MSCYVSESSSCIYFNKCLLICVDLKNVLLLEFLDKFLNIIKGGVDFDCVICLN